MFDSCSDATGPSQVRNFDASRFSWQSDTISADIVSICASDTNNVLFLDHSNLFQYDGKRYNHFTLPNGLRAMYIDGFDKFNMYIGGYDKNTGQNRIDKWNGSSFESNVINDSIDLSDIIYRVKVQSQNNIWAGTSKGKLYHFDGVSFTIYKIDTLAIFNFLSDISGNLFCDLSNLPSTDPNYHGGTYISIYELINNTWTNRYYHHFNETEDVLLPHELSGRFIDFTKKAAYELILPSYNKILDVNQFYATNNWSGNNFDNIINAGGSFNDSYPHLFHFNGSNWSDEIKLANNYIQVKIVQNIFFCSSTDPDYNYCIIYKGTPKK